LPQGVADTGDPVSKGRRRGIEFRQQVRATQSACQVDSLTGEEFAPLECSGVLVLLWNMRLSEDFDAIASAHSGRCLSGLVFVSIEANASLCGNLAIPGRNGVEVYFVACAPCPRNGVFAQATSPAERHVRVDSLCSEQREHMIRWQGMPFDMRGGCAGKKPCEQ
jgi:hypothetical protein